MAQGFSSDVKQLTRLIQQGVKHKGFALINALSPCVTLNRVNTYDFYRENLVNLDEMPDYDPSDRAAAIRTVIEHDELVTGLIFKSDEPSFESLIPGFKETPITEDDWRISPEYFEEVLAQFR